MGHSSLQAPDTIGRRRFLKTGVAAAVGTAIGSGMSAAANAKPIATRRLGKTGLQLPMLGFGGGALPKIWGNPLSTQDRVNLVRYAYDRGVRYFDTSPIYYDSEAILGEALKDRRREVCLVTKVESTKPEEVRKLVEQSLKALQTDYLDIILIHGTPGVEQMSLEQAMKIRAELVKLRDERVTRFVGFSAHGYFHKALALISSGGFDQCMLSYGYFSRGYDQVHTTRMIELRNACVAKAHELGMGIVAMKVVAGSMLGAWSGYLVPGFDKHRLNQLPAAAIRYVLQDKRIEVLNIGMRLKEEIDANIEILSGDATYTLEDRALLAEFSAKLHDTDTIKKMRVE
jgi:predicted aldo/keto reductase-like oxidoreductase